MALRFFSLLQSDNLFAIAAPYKRRTYMLKDKIIPLPASHMCRDLVQLLTDIPLLLFLSYDGSVVKFFTYINLNLLRKAPCEHKKNHFVGSLAGWLVIVRLLYRCVCMCVRISLLLNGQSFNSYVHTTSVRSRFNAFQFLPLSSLPPPPSLAPSLCPYVTFSLPYW